SAGFGRIVDNKLILHPLEACYLFELGLIKINLPKNQSTKKQNIFELLLSYSKEKRAILKPIERYAIYKEIRSVGRVVRFNIHDPNYWFVYARGVGREEERAQILLNIINPKIKIDVKQLETKLALSRQFRMEIVLAFTKNSKPQFIKLSKYSF
ncbi:MAG: hypothetical protein QW833_04200, partial [Candidatus Anstonellaceae archaeon]